jgi:hypothetical protein
MGDRLTPAARRQRPEGPLCRAGSHRMSPRVTETRTATLPRNSPGSEAGSRLGAACLVVAFCLRWVLASSEGVHPTPRLPNPVRCGPKGTARILVIDH